MTIDYFDPPRVAERFRRSVVSAALLTGLAAPSPVWSADYLNRAQMKQLMTGAVLAYKNRWGDLELTHQADGTFAGRLPARKARDRKIKGNWWINRTARLCHQVIGLRYPAR
jgi:hypothetical protein